MRKIYALLFTVVLFVSASVNAQITYTWATPGTAGDFQIGTNWTPNGIPTTGDNIIINPSASITVSSVPAIVLNNFSVIPTATNPTAPAWPSSAASAPAATLPASAAP